MIDGVEASKWARGKAASSLIQSHHIADLEECVIRYEAAASFAKDPSARPPDDVSATVRRLRSVHQALALAPSGAAAVLEVNWSRVRAIVSELLSSVLPVLSLEGPVSLDTSSAISAVEVRPQDRAAA